MLQIRQKWYTCISFLPAAYIFKFFSWPSYFFICRVLVFYFNYIYLYVYICLTVDRSIISIKITSRETSRRKFPVLAWYPALILEIPLKELSWFVILPIFFYVPDYLLFLVLFFIGFLKSIVCLYIPVLLSDFIHVLLAMFVFNWFQAVIESFFVVLFVS